MKFFLIAIALFCSSGVMADVRQMWDAMPDSVLMHRPQATIVEETPEYIEANVSSTLSVQMRLMPFDGADDVICLVKTYSAPEKESVVEVYDKKWNLLRALTFELTDVIGENDAGKYAFLFEPLLLSVSLEKDSDELTLSVSDKMLSEEEKKELVGVNLQRKVKWNKEILK